MDSTNNTGQAFPEETIDLKRYFFLFLGKWYFIAICLFAALFVAYLVNRYSEPIYSVRATIVVGNVMAPNKQGVQNLMREMNLVSDRKMIENEIGILKSYTLARTAIAELPDFKITYASVGRRGIAESKLYNRSPFVITLDSSAINPTGIPIYITILNREKYRIEQPDEKESVVVKFGEKYSDGKFSFIVNLVNPDQEVNNLSQRKFYAIFHSEHGLALKYMGKVNVALADKENSSLLNLSSQGFVAQQEADYLNKLIEVYMRNDLNEKMQTSINTILFVDNQLSGIYDSLRRAEFLLQSFRTKKGIINISTEGKSLLERLEALYGERNMLTFQLEYFKYLEGYLKEKKDFKGLVSPGTIGLEESDISKIISQLNQFALERDALLLTVKPDNLQIAKIDQSIFGLISLLFEKLDGMRQINKIRVKEINRRIAEQEEHLSLLPVTERELVNIERKYNIHEKFYTYLMEKRIEAGIAKASNVSDCKVIDMARQDMAKVVKPNRKNNYIMSLLIGLLVPMGLILLFDMLDNAIKDPSEISRKTRIPLLGTVGNNYYDSSIPVQDKPKSSFTESFRALRTNLDLLLGGEEKKAVLISSAISSEGKSFVASNLAISLAQLGKKVALLGLDLRKPKIHNLFGIDSSKGISTFLVGRNTLEEITFSTYIDNLWVLPAGPIPPNPAEMLAGVRLKQLIDRLKEEYDYIIIDSPPVAVVTDAILVSAHCDVTLFVIRHRYTSRNVLNLVDELSKSKTIKHMALLLNDFKKPKGYGYGYGYGYAYAYGYVYGYGDKKTNGGYYTDETKETNWWNRFKEYF